MAAVNEAWRVLGDPTRRRQYDRQQAERTAPSRPMASQPTGSRARPFEREPVEAGDHTNDVVAHAMRGAPLVAMLFVLLLIFVVTAFASRGSAKSSSTSSGRGLQVGSCVVVETGEPVVDVPCSEPHDGVAAAIVPLELSCPSHTEYYVAPGGGARVCVSIDGTP